MSIAAKSDRTGARTQNPSGTAPALSYQVLQGIVM